jgi:hypothetical protein
MWSVRPIESRTRLLNSTFDELRKENPVERLSRTYRDAMEVALCFGIHYLWIDSLCIIQDDSEDWRREANATQDVYRNGFISISATSGSDDTSGLYFERDTSKVAPTVVYLDAFKDSKKRPFRHDFEKGWSWSRNWHKDGKTVKRGWCFQERLLAPRVVHFVASQIYWECREQAACEVNPQDADDVIRERSYLWKRLLGSPDAPAPSDAYLRIFFDWYVALSLYTDCAITMPTDKLVALPGLVNDMRRALAKIRPDLAHRYLADLWEEYLRSALCWCTLAYRKRPPEYRAPSWSWASIDGGTSYASQLGNSQIIWIVDESECVGTTEHLGDSDTGQVLNGSLELTGPWLRIRLDGPGDPGYTNRRLLRAVYGPETQIELVLPALDEPEFRTRISLDTNEDLSKEAFCIPILAHSYEAKDAALRWNVIGLVFLPVEGSSVFRRIGLMDVRLPSKEAVQQFVSRF